MDEAIQPTPTGGSPEGHVPVLAAEVLALLAPGPGMTCLDCTVGRAGHAALIVPRLSPGGRYLGLDADPANAAFSRERLRRIAPLDVKLDVLHRNFAQARPTLDELGVEGIDLLLADLGFASNQMDDPTRGLSFMAEGPLDMRLDTTLPTTAADLVNDLDEGELAEVIYQYGEERFSRKIARKIVEERGRAPIQNTRQLADVVRRAYGGRSGGGGRIDPATRTFMALRIAVNAELDALRSLLAGLPNLLASGGVATIISFHSLEDRLVKHAFAEWRRRGLAEVLTKKPMIAGATERRSNPRSRSAKLRGIRWR